MRTKDGTRATGSRRNRRFALGAIALCVSVLGITAVASALTGAIFTTDVACGGVNINLFDAKEDVYLNGGPQGGGPGLPEGDYYVKVTDPSGATLLGIAGSESSPVRAVHVNALGSFAQCYQLVDILNSKSSNFLQKGYDTTPNNGNEYKVWVSSSSNFPSNENKTDNFKVVLNNPPPGVASDPIVTKEATATFDRNWTWDIDKSVTCGGSGPSGSYDDVVQKLSGTATCNYTIVATKNGPTDTNWKVSGTISVANPNSGVGEVITLTSVTDVITGGLSAGGDVNCVVKNGDDSLPLDVTIDPSSSNTYNYVCTYASAPSSVTTNTATATWAAQNVGSKTLAAGSTTGSDDFAFDTPNETNECTKVTDTLDGTTTTLGASVCATTTFTPSVNFPVPRSGCADHNNTAKSDPTDDAADNPNTTDTDSASVRICGPVGGEGTMGFWQNKNGQKLIQNAGSATVCGITGNLTTYLRSFAPFQDLSSSANNQAVQTYVTNIIKAANASGPTMNAMLKAQMLSTALDVFFGKVPGGTLPGGAEVDLASWGAAFNNQASMTVCEMLAYAASQSDVGGVNWYGQVKAIQELAKNAFDAINNGVALSI